MNSGNNYTPPNLEDKLRHMIMHSPSQPLQGAGQHPMSQMHTYPSVRPPPGFNMAPMPSHQNHYSNNVPPNRQQGFSQFLQQHHVAMPAPHHQPPQAYGNGLQPRPQGPHHNSRPMDPNDFHRPRQEPRQFASQRQDRQLYQPQSRPNHYHNPYLERQWQFLDWVASQEIPKVEMVEGEVERKDAFRVQLQNVLENLKSPDPKSPLPSVVLQVFGSLSSGFATAGSDMDLAIVTASDSDLDLRVSSRENSLPRVLEKELLEKGIGARLLTRTRVPIIKICEKPTPELLAALREARTKWDELPDEEKYASSKAPADDTPPKKDLIDGPSRDGTAQTQIDSTERGASAQHHAPLDCSGQVPTPSKVTDRHGEDPQVAGRISSLVESTQTLQISQNPSTNPEQSASQSHDAQQNSHAAQDKQANRQRNDKAWRREKTAGPLDFPKDGVGIQCDINFFNPLGIHNTKMLRCYSKCDPRVKPMVLFVKAWAKRRKINSSYSGTLSSYGYVLMVLHYLVNIARPPVLPNLQHQAEAQNMPHSIVDGYEVRFFDDEDSIESRARQGALTRNNEPLGLLLVGFFKYYAVRDNGFFWTRDVLSLRTLGGTLTKEEKGWTGAKTEVGEFKEVRHRYLFAIEDPFETTHNVARTVTHNGIVAIRDEFRRAWRILATVGRGRDEPEGQLFDELTEVEEQPAPAPVAADPLPAVNRVEEYSHQFPTLSGVPGSAAPKNSVSPPQAPAQRAQAAPLPSHNPAQPPQPVEPASVAPRPKGRKQKFVPLDL